MSGRSKALCSQDSSARSLHSRRDFSSRSSCSTEYDKWSIENYNNRMGEIRRYFDSKFGTGKLVSRTRDTDSDVIQTLVGYQWIVGGSGGGGTMLELFYFSAQREALVYRTITVTYKAM